MHPHIELLKEKPVSTQREAHWDSVYEARPTDELGWYEPEPSTMALVTAHSTPDSSVIDIGGGDSRLVDELIERGHRDVTVLDLSGAALERARRRLGLLAKDVQWVHGDVTRFAPERRWDLWHDRAVFHFLVEKEQRAAYLEVARRALEPAGMLVVATFSSDGPETCAGLPVCRYDLESLPEVFRPAFELVDVAEIAPGRSPVGDQRPYVGAVFRVS